MPITLIIGIRDNQLPSWFWGTHSTAHPYQKRYQALPTFPYYKWRKAGWSLGTRLPSYPLADSAQYSPCGLHEGCAASLGLMVDVGALVDEELDHTLMSLPASKGERGIIVTARWNIDLGPRVQEKLCSFVVTLSVWKNKVINLHWQYWCPSVKILLCTLILSLCSKWWTTERLLRAGLIRTLYICVNIK